MGYFILFLVCAGTWVALVVYTPKMIERLKKVVIAKAKYVERIQNPPPCIKCMWAEAFLDDPHDDKLLALCNHPRNSNRFAEVFRKFGQCVRQSYLVRHFLFSKL